MIRINLIPVRQVRRTQAGARQLVLLAVLLVVELGGLFVVYQLKAGEVDEKKRNIASLQADIEGLKKEVGDYDNLRNQRDRLISQRNVINSLQKARSGPLWLMRELSDIMSAGKGPTIDQTAYETLLRRDPTAGFNPRWNPRRLWLLRMDEKAGNVSIEGRAKDYDDVAELMKRLTLSQHFSNVQLLRNDQVSDSTLGMKVIKFSMTFQASY